MYLPQHFDEQDQVILQRLMSENPFAALITVDAQGAIHVNHFPFRYDAARGVLFAHMARANAQWKTFAEPREVLVMFQGPHAYVSPTWYGKASDFVPTWNYAIVHAWGEARLLSPDATWDGMRQLVSEHESKLDSPWDPSSVPDGELKKMLKSIVGFEIKITRLEGKLKLSQNRDAAAQDGAIAALLGSDKATDRAVGELMRERLRG